MRVTKKVLQKPWQIPDARSRHTLCDMLDTSSKGTDGVSLGSIGRQRRGGRGTGWRARQEKAPRAERSLATDHGDRGGRPCPEMSSGSGALAEKASVDDDWAAGGRADGVTGRTGRVALQGWQFFPLGRRRSGTTKSEAEAGPESGRRRGARAGVVAVTAPVRRQIEGRLRNASSLAEIWVSLAGRSGRSCPPSPSLHPPPSFASPFFQQHHNDSPHISFYRQSVADSFLYGGKVVLSRKVPLAE